jgi:hypothetical protein
MKSKKMINETIMMSAISPISFIVLIDAANIIEKRKNLLQFMFSNESANTIKSWFYKFSESKSYKESSEKLQSIGARFSTKPTLKVLYKSLDTLKSASYTQSERESHEADIRKIIEKIGLFIKKRLTEEDIEVLESVLSEINSVAENLSKKIDDQIENSMEMEQKTEVKINERLRNKLRKKIKEIVRTHLLNNR